MGPAAIQNPSPMQMLAANFSPAIKENSENVTSFDHIKAILSMTRASGQYFDALNNNDKQTFKKALEEAVIPRARIIRMVQKINEIIINPDKEEAYEQFLEYIFSATIILSKSFLLVYIVILEKCKIIYFRT